jgi:hypothetical protein
MAGPFSREQLTFAFSMMADLSAGQLGPEIDIELPLASHLTDALTTFKSDLGAWELVWGPAVRVPNSVSPPINTMFVVRGVDDPGRLVVAIAGTNPFSAFDWLIEDERVFIQRDWTTGSPAPGLRPKIANGTDRGLGILLAIMPGPGVPGVGTRLPDFLGGLPPGPLDVTVTGHSLGGALAPALALWLNDSPDRWDKAGLGRLSCVAFAGPTPGNGDFASYYASTPLGARTTRIHNSLDVVPHAWSAPGLAEVPDLYNPPIKPDPLVKGLARLARVISARGDYSHVLPDAPAFSGAVNTPAGLLTLLTPFQHFIAELVYQHVEAYFTELEMPDEFRAALNLIRDSVQLLGPQGGIATFAKRLAANLASHLPAEFPFSG